MHFRKKLLLLIFISTLLRCCVAGFLEFGNDEVYYWTYALHLQWNYFDHPPMLALLIRLATLNLYFQQEFFIRLGSILCAAVNTWLIFLIGAKIKDEKAGWYAALFYTASFYCSIIAGTFILPDSPQLLFWVWSVYLMTKVIGDQPSAGRNKNLLLLGITIGLCIMSKVHGIFLWIGFGAYILFFDRKFFKNFYLYLSLIITIVIISPIFFWNLQNHFITYSFHNNRVGFFGKSPDIGSFIQQLSGSVFYNNPVSVVLYVMALVAIAKKKVLLSSRYVRLYVLLGLPLIGVLLLMSLFNDTLPHWSGPAYISIMLLAAAYFSAKQGAAFVKTPRSIRVAVSLFFVIVILGIPVIRWIPAQLGSKEEKFLGKGDITLDMSGWKKFSIAFDSLYRADEKNGTMQPGALIISDYWFPAAHLDYYVARPLHQYVFAVGKLTDIHHYGWLNRERPAFQKGNDAYFIYPSNYYGPPRQELKNYFRKVDDSLTITQYRTGIPVRNFIIYRMHGYLGGINRDGVMNDE